MRFVWPPAFVDERGPVMTCVHFSQTQIRTHVDAILFTVWSPLLTQVDAIQLFMLEIYNLFATCTNLRADLRIRLATRLVLIFSNLLRLPSTCKYFWPGL